jgi:hypothetical protein
MRMLLSVSALAIAVSSPLHAQLVLHIPDGRAVQRRNNLQQNVAPADSSGGTTGGEGSSFLSRADAGVWSDRGYVLTTLFTGYLQSTTFVEVSLAKAVASKDTTAPTLTAGDFKQAIADLLEVTQNGGGFAGRIAWQKSSGAQSASWRSISMNGSLGALGLLGDASAARLTGGVNIETVISRKLTNADASAQVGEIYAGGKLGAYAVADGVAQTFSESSRIGFAQGLIQLRANGKVILGVSFNWVSQPFKPLVAPVHFYTTATF